MGESGLVGHAYAVSGLTAEARKALAELKELSKRRYVAPVEIAFLHAGLGENTQALDWLEKAWEDRSFRLTWIKVWPQFDHLRGEPRFQALIRRMGLQP